MTDAALRNISDTARWVAVYRAIESERPDAWFHDPLAARLAGDRGREIAGTMDFAHKNSWSFVARTVLFDRFVAAAVKEGADMVVNLAAGLDTRPYRMDLPADLPWIEVDLPELLHDKTEALAGETPRCRLERVALDLSDRAARRALFDALGPRARHVLVMSEGLIVYLDENEVTTLAEDLLCPKSFKAWALDMVSPRLMRMLESSDAQKSLSQAGAPLKFAPVEGPAFFSRLGWTPVDVASLLHTAARLKRLPLRMRLMAFFPDPAGQQPNAPWGGACVFKRSVP
jgi:methyltransferase (TIGR00027 family)